MQRQLAIISILAAIALTASAGCQRIVSGNSASEVRITRKIPTPTPPTEFTSDWPCLFGPQHLGVSTEQGLALPWGGESPTVSWSRQVGTGYSAPVVADGCVVVMHRQADEEIVEAIDARTGSPLWEFHYPTSYECPYDYSSGPYSTPVIHEGRVYAIGAEAQLHCLDLQTGSLLWQRRLVDEYRIAETLFAFGASPLVEGNCLFLNLGAVEDEAGIIAIDTRDGTTLWTATDDGPGYATPIAATMHDRRRLFVLTREGLVCLEPAHGTVHWEVPFQPRKHLSVNATSPVVLDDLVLVSAGPGQGTLCLRVLDDGYDEVWRDRRVLDSQFNNLVVVDDHLFGFTSSRQGGPSFRCLDPRTGELCWELQSAIERGSVLAVDGHLLLLGEHGHLGCGQITTDSPPMLTITLEPLLSAPTYSAPALADGRLYLRNEDTLMCVNLRR